MEENDFEIPDLTPPSKPKRKRIPVKANGNPTIEDPMEFGQNKCSLNARKIGFHCHNTNVDFWIDKHYHIRNQQGDEFGKRAGIEPDIVYGLVKSSIPHLILYSSILSSFTFLNYEKMPPLGRKIRVVCQAIIDECQLSGQYTVLVDDNNGSELFYCSKGKIGSVATI